MRLTIRTVAFGQAQPTTNRDQEGLGRAIEHCQDDGEDEQRDAGQGSVALKMDQS
jgi:hypothetical protein